MIDTFQNELSAPCALLHGTKEKMAHGVALAHKIFSRLCPIGVKIVKISPIITAKLDKEGYRCFWKVEYCQVGNIQLKKGPLFEFIRRNIPENTRIVKVETLGATPLHLAVDYQVERCKCAPQKFSKNESTVTKRDLNENIEDTNVSLPVMSASSIEFKRIENMITLNASTNLMEEICWMLNLNPWKKKQLDNWLVEAFQKNHPHGFNLLESYEEVVRSTMSPRDQEYPTLLHFAARFGLERLVYQILECPEGVIACRIKNKCDMTPAESAESDGRLELAMMIRRYTSLDQFCNIYIKLEEISRKWLKIDDNYINSKAIEELHRICSPLDYFHNSIISSYPVVHLHNFQLTIPYTSRPMNPVGTYPKLSIHHFQNFHSALVPEPTEHFSETPFRISDVRTELLEIIDHFRNNVQCNARLEKQVDNWKNRNNIEKSFEEKQEELEEMSIRMESMKIVSRFDTLEALFEKMKNPDVNQNISSSTLSSPGIVSTHSQITVNSKPLRDNEELKEILLSHDEDNSDNTKSEAIWKRISLQSSPLNRL